LLSKGFEWDWIDRRPKIQRLVEAAKADQNPQTYPFIVIVLETAMRKMEILKIRREHVDTDRRVVYIPQAKAGAREQPITAT
jgi:integrase